MKAPAINERTAAASHTQTIDLDSQPIVLVATNDLEIQKNISGRALQRECGRLLLRLLACGRHLPRRGQTPTIATS
jgi:hypothetical protein